ncbi:MAG: OmpA family protein [Acidobacteria bacterium]|nr:OmpA family protein [Acidobacteriota bacterium]
MRYFTGAVILTICMVTVIGCVSKGAHTQTLTDLEQARKASAQTAAAFDSYKKQATAEIEGLKQERTNLSNDLLASLTATNKLQQQLDTTTKTVTSELEAKRALEGEVKRLQDLSQQVQRLSGELRRERDLLQAKAGELERQVAALQKRAGELETEMARAADLTKRLDARDQEIGKLQASIEQEKERLRAEEAEKVRLEQERAAKEAEIQRLTKTHEDLTKSLQAEIAKGDIKIQQVRDRLTINMVDRVLFDSGQAKVKPDGLKVLKQVSDILKKVTDKQIRIEGHTDNVPIGAKLKERFPTNWELSTARATSVVRYLVEEGGVDRATLSAIGYAENRPVASNDGEEGRTANRRIEIVLYPKDLSEIVGQIKP